MVGVCSTYGEERNADKMFTRKSNEKYHLRDLGLDRRIILKWFLKKYGRVKTGFLWLKLGTGGGLL
jgi:hypothetical protein